MKKYNLETLLNHKRDVKNVIERIGGKSYEDCSRDELIAMFLPLVENIARKFSTADQASGIMDINDLIQEGSIGLIFAVDKIDWVRIKESTDKEKTIKSFLSKRIKGSIRRAVDINRGAIRIPEHRINEMRRNPESTVQVEMFFNSIFKSTDVQFNQPGNEDDESGYLQYEDKSTEYKIDKLNTLLLELMKTHLTEAESDVLRLSYGLDCDKMSAKEISTVVGFKGPSAYVRVSEMKKIAVSKLIMNVDKSQLVDFL